jgi:hypothetical protein
MQNEWQRTGFLDETKTPNYRKRETPGAKASSAQGFIRNDKFELWSGLSSHHRSQNRKENIAPSN